jgi:RHS repeat-associated protein
MRTDPGVNSGYAFYYTQDHEGSVTHLLDGRSTPSSQTGEVIERYKYDAFGAPTFLDASGNPLNPNSTVYNNRFLFTGREYAATYRGNYVPTFTFYEYRARAYNPVMGRFMSEDPKLFGAGDYNLFRYCHNDPIDNVDPMGLANMPYHLTPELMDYLYGKAMAAAQWRGSDLMHASTAGGAISIGATGYQYNGFLSAWSAAKAGATYGYKAIQRDRAQGKEGNDLREYYGTAESNKDGTFHITVPNEGNQAKYVPPSGSRKDGELGYSSTIPCGPECAGIYYAHPRPGDLIHNHPADMQAAAGAHHGAGVLAVTAAPQRGDPSSRGRPIFEGYDGTTNKLKGNSFFNQFPDFY